MTRRKLRSVLLATFAATLGLGATGCLEIDDDVGSTEQAAERDELWIRDVTSGQDEMWPGDYEFISGATELGAPIQTMINNGLGGTGALPLEIAMAAGEKPRGQPVWGPKELDACPPPKEINLTADVTFSSSVTVSHVTTESVSWAFQGGFKLNLFDKIFEINASSTRTSTTSTSDGIAHSQTVTVVNKVPLHAKDEKKTVTISVVQTTVQLEYPLIHWVKVVNGKGEAQGWIKEIGAKLKLRYTYPNIVIHSYSVPCAGGGSGEKKVCPPVTTHPPGHEAPGDGGSGGSGSNEGKEALPGAKAPNAEDSDADGIMDLWTDDWSDCPEVFYESAEIGPVVGCSPGTEPGSCALDYPVLPHLDEVLDHQIEILVPGEEP